MIRDLIEDNYKCLICHDAVYGEDEIWCCGMCSRVLHFGCTRLWRDKASQDGVWICPNCREGYTGEVEKGCFCGKVTNVEWDRGMPHSCGQTCGKFRVGTSCRHPCMMACHPGPCPPCEMIGETNECFCGGMIYTTLCGAVDNGRSCGDVCSKDLDCGEHFCEEVCHDGKCPPCRVPIDMVCFCGREQSERYCGTEEDFDETFGDMRNYSCGVICGRTLACGNHKCQEICHPGECEECMLLPENLHFCPCGKTEIDNLLDTPRENCLSPSPTCEKICGKILACGMHPCEEKCHLGPCPNECQVEVDVLCRCESTRKKYLCSEVYPDKEEETKMNNKCKRKCQRKRSCKRHQCNVACCPSLGDLDAEIHICQLQCTKTLRCGNHPCPEKCHSGHCPPCRELSYDDRICPCGKTVWKAPIRCGEPEVVCDGLCPAYHPCGHPTPPHKCHWSGECPPCIYLVEKPCFGNHKLIKGVPCQREFVSCGDVCGKPMHCLTHTCTRKCHPGPCELLEPVKRQQLIQDNILRLVKDSCGHACMVKKDCGHPCLSICHPDEPCPEVLCTETVVLSCECGRRKKNVKCSDERMPPECNDKCKQELRRIQIAEAFGVLGTDGKGPKYSDFLEYMAQVSPYFIKAFERKMEVFLDSPDEIFTITSNDPVQRKIISEYSRYYSLQRNNYRDLASPLKLTKRNTSKAPTVLLSNASKIRAINEGIIIDIDDVMPTSTLIFSKLDRRTGPNAIKASFGGLGEECKIFWVDNDTSVAIFADKETAELALMRLKGTEWNVRMLEAAELLPMSKKRSRAAKPITNTRIYKEESSDEDNTPVNPFLALEHITDM